MLAEPKRWTDGHGARRVVLKTTGNLQLEALGLYRSAGYREIPCYGVYAAPRRTLCFQKLLAGRSEHASLSPPHRSLVCRHLGSGAGAPVSLARRMIWAIIGPLASA
jgi:hypothetical protein